MAKFVWHLDEFENIRKSEGMIAFLETVGTETEAKCNADLHAAQAKRKQPVEDGYTHSISTAGSRARLYINTYTARAAAHEAVNQSVLKNIPVGEVKNRQPPERETPRDLGYRGNAGKGFE